MPLHAYANYAHQHPWKLFLFSLGTYGCLCISLTFIIHLWFKHRGDPLLKKIGWSLVLCLPFFGWLFYGAFYTPLSQNDIPLSVSSDAFYGGH